MDNEPGVNISGRELLALSALSLLVYLFLAQLLFYFFHDGGPLSAFAHGLTIPLQLLTGLFSGCTAAGMIIFFASRSPVEQVLEDFTLFRVIANTDFSSFDRIQVSLFAGIGEELLFRGAIQPLLGIWITSFIFIAIHGYFSFRSAGHILFGMLMFGLSMMLGILFEFSGLFAAMSAHAAYDMLMLWWVRGYRII
ncbi:MAG: CPBP family intramembrane glutamic endopeptidase [Balneolaceae bacterium]